MLTPRQKKILKLIVENYSETATPISSENLARAVNVSSATVRNEMAELSELGYLTQPHTSAGRVPSELGWKMYVDQYVTTSKQLPAKYQQAFAAVLADESVISRDTYKKIAKIIVEFADAAVMVAYTPRDIYYTGLTNLFSQPEFHELQAVVQISQVIDHLDESMTSMYYDVDQLQITVGQDNVFSPECSLVIAPLYQGDEKYIVGILGPMRMNYALNCALLNHTQAALAKS